MSSSSSSGGGGIRCEVCGWRVQLQERCAKWSVWICQRLGVWEGGPKQPAHVLFDMCSGMFDLWGCVCLQGGAVLIITLAAGVGRKQAGQLCLPHDLVMWTAVMVSASCLSIAVVGLVRCRTSMVSYAGEFWQFWWRC